MPKTAKGETGVEQRPPFQELSVAGSRAEEQRGAEAESDALLIERIAGGSRIALASLYQRHAPRLFALGRAILGAQDGAEDVLQDVFVEIWQKSGDYDPSRGQVLSWMLMRMRCRSVDRLRVLGPLPLEFAAYELGNGARSLEGDPSVMVDRSRVCRALALLPYDERVTLHLAYFKGLTGAEIAEQSGTPLGTIKTRLARGMLRLRLALGAELE